MSIQRTVLMINLALLTLGAYVGAGLVYRMAGFWIQPAPMTVASSAPALETGDVEMQSLDAYKPILERDLFKTQKEAKPPEANPDMSLENLEATQLKLKLWGTVSGMPDQAYAVIEDTQKREQNLYRVGDTIQEATLKTILREKVILSVQGKDEILAMEDLQQGQTGAGPAAFSPGMPPPMPAEASMGDMPGVRTQRVSLRREMINEAMQDVSKIMTEISIRPHLEDGQPSGLALTDIKPNSIFRRMGLRNGDILKGVDGQQIQSVDDALKLYENLRESSSVDVQIQRRGQDRTINYNIR